MRVAMQLSLFPEIIGSADLVAIGSLRHTFYRIWIESYAGEYRVIKESGARGKVLDRREWVKESFELAQQMFDRKVKDKTNPERKSPRKYRCINKAQLFFGKIRTGPKKRALFSVKANGNDVGFTIIAGSENDRIYL